MRAYTITLTLRLALGVSLMTCLCLMAGRFVGVYVQHGPILVYATVKDSQTHPPEFPMFLVDVERSIFSRLRTREVDSGVYPACSVTGQVAFASAEGSNFWDAGDIYVVDMFGGGGRQVTQNRSGLGSLNWSPDGTRLAFVNGSGYWLGDYLYVVDPATGALQVVVENEEIVSPPVWSPDGRRLLYMSLSYHEPYIKMVTLDDDSAARLTQNEGAEMSPAWSLDGRFLVFAANLDRSDYDLYRMDGNKLQPLTQAAADEYFPVWSPDGKRLAYIATEQSRVQLLVMDADGNNPRLLAEGMPGGITPLWSPDGKYLVFVTGRELQYRDVYLVPVDGSGQRRLAQTEGYLSLAWCP